MKEQKRTYLFLRASSVVSPSPATRVFSVEWESLSLNQRRKGVLRPIALALPLPRARKRI